MAPQTLTDYERRRLENIRRNDEMMASLMLHRKASDLSSSLKRPRPSSAAPKPDPDQKKNSKSSSQTQSPVVIRRSLRTRGIPPSNSPQTPPSLQTPPSPPNRQQGPLLIRDAFIEGPCDSDCHLMNAILTASSEPKPDLVRTKGFDPRSALMLRPENVAKVVSERIFSVRFLPFGDRTVVVVGNKIGNVGFWDADSSEGEGGGVCVYAPHSAPVSGISVHHFSLTKIFTSSYDGFIRLMDVEKETFNMICTSDHLFYSICQRPHDINSLFIGEGGGMLKVWDERAGKASSSWDLHEDRINTIDFTPENVNLMATSSTDGMACIWDLRSIKKDRPESLKSVHHHRAVHSAYFSPSGSCLATTSVDDKVGILSGSNFDDLSMIPHNNRTGRWLSSFRAVWGWNDSYLFLGNMRRAVDVISTSDKTTTALESPDMTSIPCRFAAHPYKLGSLAGATSGGKVFLWTKE